MKRWYLHCPECRRRMRRFDKDEGRVFFYCPGCSNRLTYMIEVNGVSDDWPREVFDKSVEEGVYRKDGCALSL